MNACTITDPPPLKAQEWALLSSVYLSQLVAQSFFFVGLVAILRGFGLSLDRISSLYLLALVPALKFLWGPLMDRIGFGRHGHYRIWLLLMQCLLVLVLLGLAHLDAATQFLPLFGGCLLLAFITANQDMAAHGLSCRLLPPQQRGMGNALQIAGGMLGQLVGGGLLLVVYEHWGWALAVQGMAVANFIVIGQLLLYREPPHARPQPVAVPRWRVYWRQLAQFWRSPATGWRWAVVVATMQFGVCLAYGVMTPMLVDSGWNAARIGTVVNVQGSLAGLVASLLMGLFIRRVGPEAAMRWALPAQTLGIAALALPLIGAGTGWIAAGVALYMSLYVPLATVLATLMMAHASPHAPATDFSMQYGLFAGAGFLAAGLAMPLAARLGYGTVLALAVVCNLLAAAVLPLLYAQSCRRATASIAAALDAL